MAMITRGAGDEMLSRIKAALDDYEQIHPGSFATLYRQNSASVRVRIVDDRFIELSDGDRYSLMLQHLSDRLDRDDIDEISVLLLLTQAEQNTSFMNSEFNDPIPSNF